jgi:hypothetical protein
MCSEDPNPAHFHAEDAGDEALIWIDTLEVIAGHRPAPVGAVSPGAHGVERAGIRDAFAAAGWSVVPGVVSRCGAVPNTRSQGGRHRGWNRESMVPLRVGPIYE